MLLSAALPASAIFFDEGTEEVPVAYDLLKNAPAGEQLTLLRTDFLTDGGELDAIVLSALPDSQAGTQTLGGQLLRVGDVISMEAVDGPDLYREGCCQCLGRSVQIPAGVQRWHQRSGDDSRPVSCSPRRTAPRWPGTWS